MNSLYETKVSVLSSMVELSDIMTVANMFSTSAVCSAGVRGFGAR
jgi:hypothetical protein